MDIWFKTAKTALSLYFNARPQVAVSLRTSTFPQPTNWPNEPFQRTRATKRLVFFKFLGWRGALNAGVRHQQAPFYSQATMSVFLNSLLGDNLIMQKTFSLLAIAIALGFALNANAAVIATYHAEGNADDSTGSHNGSIVDAVSYAPGHIGQAFDLNGGYIQVPHDSALSLESSYTISAWIKLESDNFTGRIVDKITAGGLDGYLLDVLDGRLRLISGSTAVNSSTLLPVNELVQVAGAFDGNQLTIYVNGNLVGQEAGFGLTQTNNLPLRIGADSNGGNLFYGLIDEVQISNTFDLPEPGTLALFAVMPLAYRATRRNNKRAVAG